jgi:hypothetical protein
MMGVSAARTAAALDPRSARISVRSRSRIRWIAATDGLISNTAPYRRTLNPRKSNPVDRGTIVVLSSLKTKPRGASHSARLALTCSACRWEWQSAIISSAYLITTGEPTLMSPALRPAVM